MFTTLFGSELPLAARFFIAFLVVLALIGVTAWLVRRFGVKRLGGNSGRGRQPRLAVIDAATVDGRRRLVLIRRDNIEHLLMIGGPTDVVIEPNIIRAAGAREVVREPGRGTPSDPSARVIPPAENGWPLQPANEPPPLRSQRASATEEPWHAPEPGARPRPADTLTGLAAELSNKLNFPENAPPPQLRAEPRVSATMPVEPASAPQNDQNLAAMAQQLEAALRRTAPDGRPPVTDPLAASAANVQSKAPSPAREVKQRAEPKLEPKPSPKVEVPPEPKTEILPASKSEPRREAAIEPPPVPKREQKIEAKPEPKPAQALEPAAAGTEVFDSLEEEMANLLGRPAGKS